jgi:hypothetical protein
MALMADMRTAFEYVAVTMGRPVDEARRFAQLLKSPLLDVTPKFFGGMWTYPLPTDPIVHNDDLRIIDPTRSYPSIQRLYCTIGIAERYLPPDDLSRFLSALCIIANHNTHLDEAVPLFQIEPKSGVVRYEAFDADGYLDVLRSKNKQRKRADLLFQCDGEIPVLLEIKSRLVDLKYHLTQIASGIPESKVSPSAVKRLLDDIVQKFPECAPAKRLQGAWVTMNVFHIWEDLWNEFNQLDFKRVHFLVFWHGGGRAQVLARTAEIETSVVRFFRLQPPFDNRAESTGF